MRRSRKSSVNRCGQPSGSSGGVGVGAAADEGLAEIGVATNLRSKPHRYFSRVFPGKSEGANVSPVKMLAGRECNYSGRSRFSSADRCHVSSRYLPVNGPSVIDRMNSCAYVSQFSADGTLFVAGFQVLMSRAINILCDVLITYVNSSYYSLFSTQDSDIKIYSVDNGWQVKKNIRARSLRWTITDTSLSLDQRFLVCLHIMFFGA